MDSNKTIDEKVVRYRIKSLRYIEEDTRKCHATREGRVNVSEELE